MIQTVNLHDFRKAFQEIRPNNFSYEGLERLYDYFEQLEDELKEKIELDVIAICCDYSEMTQVEILETYSNMLTIDESKNQYSQIMDFLNNNTCVIGDTPQGTIIYQNF
jgi:hypothetical protein